MRKVTGNILLFSILLLLLVYIGQHGLITSSLPPSTNLILPRNETRAGAVLANFSPSTTLPAHDIINTSSPVPVRLSLRAGMTCRPKRIRPPGPLQPLPPCPRFTSNVDDNDAVLDRRTSWVEAKYKLYASRCARREGVMWAQLSRRSHDAILHRVLSLAMLGLEEATLTDIARGARRFGSPLRVLDWGCGCGIGVAYLRNSFANASVQTEIVGIDITKAAIEYAKSIVSPGPLLCHADGTILDWLPDNSMHLVVSFGALLHLPKSLACNTIQELTRIVRPGGVIWGGYIDDPSTLDLLEKCRFTSCDYPISYNIISEREWFRGIPIPKANRKRKPHSIVFTKLPY